MVGYKISKMPISSDHGTLYWYGWDFHAQPNLLKANKAEVLAVCAGIGLSGENNYHAICHRS